MWENLEKNKFKQQIFEDLIIEKIDIRKAIYNKTEEDFLEIYKGIIDILKILRI